MDSIGVDPEVDEARCVVVGAREHGGELFVEGAHQCAASPRHEGVVEELVDVCGEVGVVDPCDWDAHEFGGEHPDHSHSAGGGDVDHIGAVVLGGAEHGEHRGDREIERVVSRHGARVEGGEVLDVGEWFEVVGEVDACGGEDGEVVVGAVCGGGGVLDEAADAVDVDEGVGELEDTGRGGGCWCWLLLHGVILWLEEGSRLFIGGMGRSVVVR